MTATLIIKAEGTGALAVLDRVNTLIDSSVKGSEKLAAVTATIRGHWRAIGDDVGAVTRAILGARTETERMAGSAKVMHAGFLSTIGVAQRLASEMRSVKDEAIATARVVNAIRAPRSTPAAAASAGGTSTPGTWSGTRSVGFAFTPTPAARSVISDDDFANRYFAKQHADDERRKLTFTGGNNRSTYGSGVNVGQGLLGSIGGASISTAARLVETTISKSLQMAWSGFKVGATAAVATAAGLVGNSIRLALKAEPIAGGFGALTESKGLGGQVEVLKALQTAARGTVSDLQLMTNANVALQLGSASTTKELELLIEGGRRLGKAMGRDATEGFNDLALGIGRQSKLILDNLGIIINADQVYEDYAKSVGSTTEKISDQEKKLAFVSAAYDAVRQKMADLGDEQITAAENIDRAQASFSNLSVQLGQKFLPVIGEVAGKWADFLSSMNADEVSDAMMKSIDGVKSAVGNVVDFIFPSSIVSDFSNLGSSVWDAFTDPSKEAFEIVGLRFEKLWVDAKLQASQFFDFLTSFDAAKITGLAGIDGLASGLKSVGLDSAAGFLKKKTASKFGEVAGGAAERLAPNIKSASDDTTRIDLRIAELQKAIANRPQKAEFGRLASGDKDGSGSPNNEALLGIARAAREVAESAAKAKAEADKAAERALRDEIAIREKLIDSMRDEQRLIEDAMKELSGSRENASRALRGEGPAKTLSAQLDDSAKSLREFPAIFDKIAIDISETGRQITDSISSFHTELDGSFRDISRGLRAQANEFLQQDPQDGESVRVRSLKRRAQRDLRRSNLDTINGAFSSQGPGGYANASIFGQQNSERSGSVLNQSFPRLESALARLRSPDGSTQIAAIETQLTSLVSAQATRLEELRAAQAKNFAEQAKATEDQIAATDSTRKFVEQATATIGSQAKELARLKTTIDKSVAEMKKLEQAVRKQ